jgi:hypothetical protein
MSQRETDELYQFQVAAAITQNVQYTINEDVNYSALKLRPRKIKWNA